MDNSHSVTVYTLHADNLHLVVAYIITPCGDEVILDAKYMQAGFLLMHTIVLSGPAKDPQNVLNNTRHMVTLFGWVAQLSADWNVITESAIFNIENSVSRSVHVFLVYSQGQRESVGFGLSFS